MKSTTYQWKLPLLNSESHLRNTLTLHVYLSFLTVYPSLLLFGINVGWFPSMILSIVASIIVSIYGVIGTKLYKKYKIWVWSAFAAVFFYQLIQLTPYLSLIGTESTGILLGWLFRPFILLMTPVFLTTSIMGFLSPVVLLILGFRKQESSIIEAEFTALEESESAL